jgi:hypothetical protein
MWSTRRETVFRLWIRQLVALSYLFVRAGRWARASAFILAFLSILGSVFTLPGYGCGLVSGEVCVQLQWTGIIMGIVTGIGSGIGFAYDPAMKALAYDSVATDLLKLSRLISLELQKPTDMRQDPSQFAQEVVELYDEAMLNVRLPWYVSGENHLSSLSLLESFRPPPGDSAVEDDSPIPEMGMTDVDREVQRRIEEQMNRLGGVSIPEE